VHPLPGGAEHRPLAEPFGQVRRDSRHGAADPLSDVASEIGRKDGHGLYGRELRPQINEDGTLTLSLQQVEIHDPGDDEIIVRVEASPINPSDLGLLLGPPTSQT
jgi:hypothetical protein